jgi:phage terminase large subunit-like protein
MSIWAPDSWEGLSDADRVAAIMSELRTPTGRGAGEPFRERDWQADVRRALFETAVMFVVASVARGNGKSTWAAALAVAMAVAGLMVAPFIPIVATSEEQARRLLAQVVRFVSAHPELACRGRVYSDRVTFPAWDATIIALPSESSTLLGLDFGPIAIADEIGAMSRDTFDALATAAGKREGARLLAVGSQVPGGSPVLDELLAVEDPAWRSFYWAPEPGCEIDDQDAWAAGNPTLDDLVTRETMRTLAATMPETTFRSLRLNERTHAVGTWITREPLAACADATRVVPDGAEIVVGFDGSYSQDSTALVGCTVERPHHLFVLGVWETHGPGWRVPRGEVDAIVRATFDRYPVRRMVADRYGWQSEIESWARAFGEKTVLVFPMTHARFGAAADRMFTAVNERTVTHDGDHRLIAHFLNARCKPTPWGMYPVKIHKDSERKIDLAVAATLALSAAADVKPRQLQRVAGF